MDMNINSMIPSISTAFAQGNVMTQIGAKMLTDQVDVVSGGVAELTKAMELSVNPNIGANFDVAI